MRSGNTKKVCEIAAANRRVRLPAAFAAHKLWELAEAYDSLAPELYVESMKRDLGNLADEAIHGQPGHDITDMLGQSTEPLAPVKKCKDKEKVDQEQISSNSEEKGSDKHLEVGTNEINVVGEKADRSDNMVSSSVDIPSPEAGMETEQDSMMKEEEVESEDDCKPLERSKEEIDYSDECRNAEKMDMTRKAELFDELTSPGSIANTNETRDSVNVDTRSLDGKHWDEVVLEGAKKCFADFLSESDV